MTSTPLPIQALRGAAIVLALGAGSWLVVSSQRSANPQVEPNLETRPAEPIPEAVPGESMPVTGNPFLAPGGGQSTFIYGSKSFIPPTATVAGDPVAGPGQVLALPGGLHAPFATEPDPTFLFSSKSIPLEAFKTIEVKPPGVLPSAQKADKTPTFLHSSKMLNLPAPSPKVIDFPPAPKQ